MNADRPDRIPNYALIEYELYTIQKKEVRRDGEYYENYKYILTYLI